MLIRLYKATHSCTLRLIVVVTREPIDRLFGHTGLTRPSQTKGTSMFQISYLFPHTSTSWYTAMLIYIN